MRLIDIKALTDVYDRPKLVRSSLSRNFSRAYCTRSIEYVYEGGPSVMGIFDPLTGGLLRVLG